MAEKVSRDRGYRSDSIAVSRDMGPLSVGAQLEFLCFRGWRFLLGLSNGSRVRSDPASRLP